MRTWRVGTISMGASLLLLGIFLLLSTIFGMNLSQILLSWWPIILIVLGLEILLYLFLSKQEKPLLKYDFLSIFFVGIIGTVGIAFAILHSVGFLDLIDETLSKEDRTGDLPAFTEHIGQDVKRVVVDTEHYPIRIEGTKEQEVSLFGTYRASVNKEKDLISEIEDYLSVKKSGDTLYLKFKALPQSANMFNHYYSNLLEATLLIPASVDLEVYGHSNEMVLRPRDLAGDWMIENASMIALNVEKNSNVDISVAQAERLVSNGKGWMEGEKSSTETTDENIYDDQSYNSGRVTIGEGTNKIDIMQAHEVSLNLLD